MVDCVRIRIGIGRQAEAGLPAALDSGTFERDDVNTWRGRLGNLGIRRNPGGLTIRGSLAKFLKGQNAIPLIREGVREAVGKLEDALGLDLSEARVQSVEFGTTAVLKKCPHEYMRLFGDVPRMGKWVHSVGGQIETVLYNTATGAFQFCAYDKGREMTAKGQSMPELFDQCNVMRLEWRMVRRRGILRRLGRELTAHDLYEYGTYRKLQAMFLEAYKAIPKMGREVFADLSKGITPKRWEELQAEAFRQKHH